VEDKADKTRIVKTKEKETEKREGTKRKNKEFRKLTVEEEIIEEKQKEEEDLIKIRMIEEMVPKRFHKYLKVFEKKDSKRMPIKKYRIML